MKCLNHSDVDAVSKCISCGNSICDNCRVVSGGEDYCKKCIADKATGTAKQERSPRLAAILSFLIAGAGQIYNGQLGKGLLILFTSWLILPWIYGIFDAHVVARKINEGKIAPKGSPGCAIALIIAVALMVVFVFIFGLLAAIAIPNFVIARETAMANACISNLKQIEVAKQIWAMDTGVSQTAMPNWSDLFPKYLRQRPICPKGGTYIIGSTSLRASCSVGDNRTQMSNDDHILKDNLNKQSY